MASTVTVRIYRHSGRAGEPARFDTFEVAVHQHMSVLDLLFHVVEQGEADIGFGFSCRVGMCGSCGLLVDGREALACQTPVPASGALELRPLNHLPVRRDLLVDLDPLFDRFSSVDGRFSGAQGDALVALTPDPASALGEESNCIGCGLCLSACSVLDFDAEFVGPAALYRALVLEQDPRESDAPDRLDDVTGEHGVWRCHVHQDCLDVCPKDLPLTQAIQTLKRRAVGSAVRSALGRGHGDGQQRQP